MKCVFSIHQMLFNMSTSPAQELNPLCIIQVEVMQCGGEKRRKKKKNPLPSVAASHYTSEDSLSLANIFNSRQSTNHRVIFHHQLPVCSTPVSSTVAQWHVERERPKERVRDIGEAWDTLYMVERVYCMYDGNGVSFCWGRKLCTYFHSVWLQSENVKSWTPRWPWIKGGWSLEAIAGLGETSSGSPVIPQLRCLPQIFSDINLTC